MNSFGSQTRCPSLSQRCNHFSAVEGEETHHVYTRSSGVRHERKAMEPLRRRTRTWALRGKGARHTSEKASWRTAPEARRACFAEAPAFAPARTQGLSASQGLEGS